MIKLFSADGNGSPGRTKLLYTHYKMVARIKRMAQDVCVWFWTISTQNKQRNVKI